MSIVRNVRTVDQYTRPIDTTRDRVEKLINDVQEMKQRDEQRARRTRDTFLSVATPAELSAYFKNRAPTDYGKCYDGLESAFKEMDPELRAEIFKRLDGFRADLARIATTDARRARDFDPLGRQPQNEQNRTLNEAARARWGLPPLR